MKKRKNAQIFALFQWGLNLGALTYETVSKTTPPLTCILPPLCIEFSQRDLFQVYLQIKERTHYISINVDVFSMKFVQSI